MPAYAAFLNNRLNAQLVLDKICQKGLKKCVKIHRFRLQNNQTKHTKFNAYRKIIYLDYTCNSDRITHLIHAEIRKVVRFVTHGHGASKAPNSISKSRFKMPDFYWLSPREMLAFYWLLERVVKRLSIQVFTAVSGFYGYWKWHSENDFLRHCL